jgi:hypothetical protein
MKIVINACYGGFGLSYKGVMRYAELKGIKLYPWAEDSTLDIYKNNNFEEFIAQHPETLFIHYTKVPKEEYDKCNKYSDEFYFSDRNIERTDLILIQVVEELKEEANNKCSELKVIEIPDDVEYEIDEYDGIEHIAEKHRSWS